MVYINPVGLNELMRTPNLRIPQFRNTLVMASLDRKEIVCAYPTIHGNRFEVTQILWKSQIVRLTKTEGPLLSNYHSYETIWFDSKQRMTSLRDQMKAWGNGSNREGIIIWKILLNMLNLITLSVFIFKEVLHPNQNYCCVLHFALFQINLTFLTKWYVSYSKLSKEPKTIISIWIGQAVLELLVKCVPCTFTSRGMH